VRAATHLDVPDPVLAAILSLSASTVEQARKSETHLIQDWLTRERAVPLLRLSRALDHGLGGDAEAAGSWMRSHNSAFGARPLDVLQKAGGPQSVLDRVQTLLGLS
jgi:hypothetical protein